MAQNRKKVVKFRPVYRLNIGLVTFAIIFIYLTIQIFMSLGKTSLSIYEVQKSYIDTNIHVNAFILREEKILNAESSGYISYYIRDGEKVGKNKTIYTIDETGSIYDLIKDSGNEPSTLTVENYNEIRSRISNFENYFTYANFSNVYDFKYDIENLVLELSNEALIDQITSMNATSGSSSTYKKITSEEAGIVTYYQDGFEYFDRSHFTLVDIDKSKYKKTTLKTGEIINAGSPVYKLVTSEDWYLIANISEEDAERIGSLSRIRLHMNHNPKDIYGIYELYQNEKDYFVIITLNKLMINYLNERFTDIEIIMEQTNGLKIPNTSIVEKEVYKIPTKFLTTGSNSTKKAFFNVRILDEKGEVSVKQINPDIYITDNDYCYVNPDFFENDTILVEDNSTDTFNISNAAKQKLPGVYCINQGNATFRYIDMVYQDQEFTIVKQNIEYSIALYDRIILNSSTVEENQIIK